jgi:membrane-associated phospholipid phosphatase
MLDTAPILWLQEWASPALTEIMRTVSIWGYVPSCLAIAIVCGFGWRLRLGVTLILAIVFADAMTVAAKNAFASPRPHAVDARVRTFATFEAELPGMVTGTSVPADDFGFPSGHVATTAAWALGLAWTRRNPWQTGAAAAWIALMALSRLYLGRHFPADVVGGLVVGVAGLALARVQLPPVVGDARTLATGSRAALGVSLLVVVALAALSGAGLGAHDAGRFCGLVGAALVLMRARPLEDSDALLPGVRLTRMAAALVLCGVAVWSSSWAVVTGTGLAFVGALAVSAALHASVLLVPVLVLGRRRS